MNFSTIITRLLAKKLKKMISEGESSPTQIVFRVENHFHGSVDHINQ